MLGVLECSSIPSGMTQPIGDDPFLPESPLDAHCEAFVAGGQGEVPVLVGNLKEGLPVKSMTP